MDIRTELLVVGGGLAGFAAALTAAEAGLDVVVLEKQPETGGSSAMSGGCLAFAGTDIQRSHGIEDSSDLLFKDLREVGQFENDEALVRAYADEQLATYEWLKDCGAEFNSIIEAASGQSVPRAHTVDPADLVRQLAARAKATGKVKLIASARATRLLHGNAERRVVAAAVEHEGSCITVSGSRAVLLASGGFCRNAKLVHRFAPQYDAAIFIGGDGNEGDGLRMAWALGADFRDMAYIKGTYGKHPTDEANQHSCLAVYKGAIAVNQNGKRYVDESLSYKLLGDACMLQPYSTTYQILDQNILESGDNRVRIMDFERRLDEGLFIQADSLEALAEKIEIPADALIQTVARYNHFVDQGVDDDFGRKRLVHRHGSLRRIERAPFYAYPSTAVVFGTYCGLCVDASMRVIDVFGQPISGLLAAGEVVGGLHGAAYMTGSALGKAAIFGRIAGRTASREAAR
ncbi:Fumarate reductase flavoprotein subunit [Methylocella tundrae]|uniref:Fumarate reductase flavoprotein subunit n=2 Tax=Methylocella tundrae TaxID=227605 RepID=A0A8B6M8D3_METTU|nr:Fumarate reductase flavoprotein subunit [Methylocella tundrae]